MSLTCSQSGQSLIEHSYKADSDLSPAGWEYAERLKEFVLDRRAKSFEQRGIDGTDRRLVVRLGSFPTFALNTDSESDMDLRSAAIAPLRLAFPQHVGL